MQMLVDWMLNLLSILSPKKIQIPLETHQIMVRLVKRLLDHITGNTCFENFSFNVKVPNICVLLSSIKSGMSEKDKELDSLLKSIAKEPSSNVHANEAINDANSIKYCVCFF